MVKPRQQFHIEVIVRDEGRVPVEEMASFTVGSGVFERFPESWVVAGWNWARTRPPIRRVTYLRAMSPARRFQFAWSAT